MRKSDLSDELSLIVWASALWAAAIACAAILAYSGVGFSNLWAVLGLGALGAMGERSRVRLSSNLEVSISLVPGLFAAVAFGPLEAMVVAAVSMAATLRPPYMKWAVYTPAEALAGAGAGLAALEAATLVNSRFGSVVLGAAAGAFAAQTLDAAFAAITVRLRHTGSGWDVARTLAPVVLASAPLYAPIVALLVLAYESVSPWTLPLFLAPTLAAQRLFVMYQHQRMLTDDLRRLNAHLERANLSFAAGLVATLDARDEYTAGHSTAVAAYSRDIARELGLSHEEREQVFVAALVHDIGKIGLPAALLEKPGPLNLAERRRMQEHATIGERILRQVETYGDIARVVRHHHERFDGQGYPDGLRGDAIPQLSRIIAVADSYNAMTSNRPYRDAMDPAIARERLAAAAGSQFDPVIVEAFDAVLEAADEAYRRGRGPMFIRPIARQALPRQSELISSAA